jgi:hypothetical protein
MFTWIMYKILVPTWHRTWPVSGQQKCCAEGSGKDVKIQEFMYRDTTNVEPEMYDYTSNNWSHWNSDEMLTEKFGSCTRKTFDRFTTKDSCIWNITHNTESTTVWSLKPERWGSTLVQEKYQEEKACHKRHPCHIIIIIIIIIIITIIIIIIINSVSQTTLLISLLYIAELVCKTLILLSTF